MDLVARLFLHDQPCFVSLFPLVQIWVHVLSLGQGVVGYGSEGEPWALLGTEFPDVVLRLLLVERWGVSCCHRATTWSDGMPSSRPRQCTGMLTVQHRN